MKWNESLKYECMHPYAYDFIKLIKSHVQVFSLTTTIALFDVLVNLANLNLSTQE